MPDKSCTKCIGTISNMGLTCTPCVSGYCYDQVSKLCQITGGKFYKKSDGLCDSCDCGTDSCYDGTGYCKSCSEPKPYVILDYVGP